MKKVWLAVFSVLISIVLVTGCSNSDASTDGNSDEGSGGKDGKITMVWYPNESGDDLKAARDEIGKVVEDALGKEVEHKLTTDYAIAIEALANENAHIAFTGAQGYVEAKNKNDDIEAIVVTSGASGTLDDAVYHSWLNVKKGNESEYEKDGKFAIDNIEGKKFSFVSNSSTSGFKVPSAGIISYFEDKDLSEEDLMEGGKFFSEVLFGGSHQGSAVNLLTDKVDVAAFCDACVDNYIELADGEENTPGAVYKVKDGAEEPFNTVEGEEFVVISVTPVLNSPISINTKLFSEDERNKLLEAFTSEEVANNEKIFVPEDSEFTGLFKKTDKEQFVEVEDSWFDPIRELSE